MKLILPTWQTLFLATLSTTPSLGRKSEFGRQLPVLSPGLSFEPNGAVLGDFGSLEEMPPKLVLNYLASCAGVEFDLDSCELDAYIRRAFPGSSFGSICSVPADKLVSLPDDVVAAAVQCQGDDGTIGSNMVGLVSKLSTIFNSEQCWNQLCAQDDIHLRIEAKWIKTCANLEVPYPLPPSEDLSPLSSDSESSIEDSLLTCMLDYAMETPLSTFDLEDDPSTFNDECYPPGYDDVASSCPSNVGKKAFKKCKYLLDSDDEWMFVPTSMSYTMSYDFAPTPSPTALEDSPYINKFCGIIEDLSSERGQQCLTSICRYQPTPSPTTSPSGFLSNMPSGAPSNPPSGAPSFSVAPSAAPSSEPSLTAYPSASPTDGPSGEPSFSVVPSTAPSPRPSLSPIPSAAPSPEPTSTPTSPPTPLPTPLPSGAPSASPSTSPSSTPSLSPSTAPSVSPSHSPTNAPSESPTSVPTLSEVEAVVTVQLISTVNLDLGSSDAPLGNDGFSVIESGIEESVADVPGSVSVNLLSIDGTPVARRLRARSLEDAGQPAVLVEFMVEVIRDCVVKNCTVVPEQVMDDVVDALYTSVTNGGMQDNIRQEATESNVDALETVVVEPDSYEHKSTTSTIVETEEFPEETPPPKPTSTSTRATVPLTVLVALSLFSVVLF